MAKEFRIDPKLLDELLKDQDPKQVLSSDGLLGDLKNALAGRLLDVEMDVHLESPAQKTAGNHRHGHGRKTVLSDDGAVELSVPTRSAGPVRSVVDRKTYRRRA